jgi:hypothetical protein
MRRTIITLAGAQALGINIGDVFQRQHDDLPHMGTYYRWKREIENFNYVAEKVFELAARETSAEALARIEGAHLVARRKAHKAIQRLLQLVDDPNGQIALGALKLYFNIVQMDQPMQVTVNETHNTLNVSQAGKALDLDKLSVDELRQLRDLHRKMAGVLMPRMVMHRCSPSAKTATSSLPVSLTTSSAIWLVNCS